MTKRDFKDLERISDYSIALMDEILDDINKLSKFSSSKVETKLDDINRKIDLARKHWVNVDAIDKEVLDFRVVLFKKDINNKIEEVHTHLNNFSFDISKIECEYNELKLEQDIDHSILEEQMKNLYNEVIRAKIKFMISDIEKSDGASVFSIDQIAHELEKAREKGLRVDDIEEMLFE